MKPRTLTTDEIRYFRYNGFFKIPWILPEKIVSDLKKTIKNHIDNEIEPLVKDYRNDVPFSTVDPYIVRSLCFLYSLCMTLTN